ncbi:MAG TPA: SAM-dependent methyltransferase [Phototrophicaceae bacterium]|jgi:SAM-dependent methyltransferase|nr:SAM-dependent methyltransferase [Phototrophicaceae bacterium]
MTDQYVDLLKTRILDEATFVRATFSGTRRGAVDNPWQKLLIRPVLIKNRRHLQFSWYDQRQNFVKNYAGDEITAQLDEALMLPFANYTVQTTNGDVQVQINKKGKALVHQHAPQQPTPPAQPDLAHDREKNTLLNPETASAFLQAVGIMTQDGKIRANMQSKYVQINEFLRLLDETGEFRGEFRGESGNQTDHPLRVLDFGCGNAYLTFALYHYLTITCERECHITGIDTNQRLLDNHAVKVQALGWGWGQLDFQAKRIEDYVPDAPPDVVIALHACDTATDDALAQGIRWNSSVIVVVPCCHHNLQAQLNHQPAPAPFKEMMRYGLMHERMGDLLTDTFRALLLRIAGYKVDVVELVGTEHTPKNMMLRAVKTGKANDPDLIAEYEALKNFWNVTPYLEGLL